MKTDIQEYYDSIQFKKALQELHITNVSELKEYNCVTLANKLRTGYNKLMIIRKLNDLGYLPSAENAISIHDIPMTRKMRNIFLRNGIVYLAQLSAYPREEILQFRNIGEYAMSEIDTLCEKYGIQIRSLCPIKEAFSEFQFNLMIFKENIICYILLLKSPLTLENTKFIAGGLSLKVSLVLYLPTGYNKP